MAHVAQCVPAFFDHSWTTLVGLKSEQLVGLVAIVGALLQRRTSTSMVPISAAPDGSNAASSSVVRVILDGTQSLLCPPEN